MNAAPHQCGLADAGDEHCRQDGDERGDYDDARSLRLQMIIVVLEENGQQNIVRVSPRVDGVQGQYVPENPMLSLVDLPEPLGCANARGLKLIGIACGDGQKLNSRAVAIRRVICVPCGTYP